MARLTSKSSKQLVELNFGVVVHKKVAVAHFGGVGKRLGELLQEFFECGNPFLVKRRREAE
jgi:hypothetical protein